MKEISFSVNGLRPHPQTFGDIYLDEQETFEENEGTHDSNDKHEFVVQNSMTLALRYPQRLCMDGFGCALAAHEGIVC